MILSPYVPRFGWVLLAGGLAWSVATASVLGQQAAPGAKASGAGKVEEGLPVTSPTVQKACAPCHTVDDKQQVSRLSFQRNTPEGWQEVIRRMVALNGLQIDPQTAREVVRYLSNNHGLAPEEARPAAWDVERRWIDYKYEANADADTVCKQCHSLGRVISQRRTREEWNLLISMHRGWYPLVDNQAFRRGGPAPREPSADGRPPDARHPVEKAVDHLASAFPLKTAEWTAWSATMRPARLEGTWTISGHEPGRGAVYGRMTIKAVAGTTDEFTTEATLVDAKTGTRSTRTGQALVYTGFQWRGRSAVAGREDSSLREVMFVDREWQRIDGRWFTGGYDELGMDITLQRLGSETRVLGTSRPALRAGSSAQELKIFGANIPGALQASDVDLGPGVTVTRIANATSDEVSVSVDVAATAPVGARDLFVAGRSRPRAVAVYDSVDTLKVSPEWAMARVGGVVFPKGFAQFEARAFDNGPDDRPGTADDIDLGLVAATWSLEEFAATYGDDDVKFVGSIDAVTGLFTPNVDGPNPARSGERNNIGDVYAVASYAPSDGSGSAKPVRARAHLLVTVPLYMWWEGR
ncbi:MAG: quinohemoprotein amine dehydrogenase subunit alpha [Acidobacteriota bacterium]